MRARPISCRNDTILRRQIPAARGSPSPQSEDRTVQSLTPSSPSSEFREWFAVRELFGTRLRAEEAERKKWWPSHPDQI